MLNEIRTIKDIIRYLESCEDGVEEDEAVRDGYNQAIGFVRDYLSDVQSDLELEYSEKYTPEESYYGF